MLMLPDKLDRHAGRQVHTPRFAHTYAGARGGIVICRSPPFAQVLIDKLHCSVHAPPPFV